MKNNNIIDKEILRNIGLTKSEINLYLTNLKIGPASAIQLGQNAGVTRQMVYTLIPDLLQKGLMKHIREEEKSLYQAVSPEALKDRVQKIEKDINQIIPVLKSHQAEYSAVPMITVYENPIAMREWYRNFMKRAKKDDELLIWSTGKLSYWYGLDPEFYEKYLEFSEKTGVNSYVVFPKRDQAKAYQEKIGKPHTKVKFIAHGWKTMAEKWVWGNQICFLTIKENATNLIVIESEALAEIERFDFWKIWSSKR